MLPFISQVIDIQQKVYDEMGIFLIFLSSADFFQTFSKKNSFNVFFKKSLEPDQVHQAWCMQRYQQTILNLTLFYTFSMNQYSVHH